MDLNQETPLSECDHTQKFLFYLKTSPGGSKTFDKHGKKPCNALTKRLGLRKHPNCAFFLET